MSGYLEVCFGPMYSGKTSYLLSKILKHSKKNKKILYINSTTDTRATGPYSTHNPSYFNIQFADNINFRKLDNLSEISDIEYGKYDLILIDEAQFFQTENDLVNKVYEMVKLNEKYVCVAGLIGNFEAKKFGYLLDLLPQADNIISLKSKCSLCIINSAENAATFTKRTIDNKELIVVDDEKQGNGDIYIPVCRKHFYS